MRRHYGYCSLAILCGLFSHSVHAADPATPATRPAAAFRGATPPSASSTAPKSQNDLRVKPLAGTSTFADRLKATQQVQPQQADDSRPKPTNWQLQNPSNPSNNTPTVMPSAIASNNYFGSQYDQWSNLSRPAPMTQLRFNQTAVPAINQTTLYTAPNNYFGEQNAGWSSVRPAQPEINPFGGWNYR